MKNIKSIKKAKISPYYAAVTKIAATATAFVLVSVLLSGLYAPFGYVRAFGTHGNDLPLFAFLLSGMITVGGGFVIGLFSTRKGVVTENERIIKAGVYGLIANLLYTTGYGFLLLLNVASTNTVVPTLTSFGPAIALVIVAIIAIIDRHNPSQAMRSLPGTFVIVFWATQLWSVIQMAKGSGVSSTDDIIALAFTAPLIIAIPLVIAAAFHAALKPIGRLSRVFFATYLAALPFTFVMAGFGFLQEATSESANMFATVLQMSTVALIILTLVILIRARRLKK